MEPGLNIYLLLGWITSIVHFSRIRNIPAKDVAIGSPFMIALWPLVILFSILHPIANWIDGTKTSWWIDWEKDK